MTSSKFIFHQHENIDVLAPVKSINMSCSHERNSALLTSGTAILAFVILSFNFLLSVNYPGFCV